MPALTCPFCGLALHRAEGAYRCTSNHAFDLAREGYLNLLPVQQKKSRAPGDSADMIRARRSFLQAGHYAPLRDAALALLRPLHAHSLLDLGCGEGWYTAALAGALAEPAEVTGIDIAKDAIRLAAKQYPGITWLVGSSAALPLADGSVDVVASLFAPLPAAEIARVLRPGGHLLVAVPGAGHLHALRAALFDEVRPHEPEKFLAQLASSFTLAERQSIGFPLRLDARALHDLLLMTPYAWRAKAEKRAALLARADGASRETHAEFALFLLRRIAPG